MVYNNDKTLNYLLTDEGRVTKQGSSFTYEYHLKDHLGNTRVSFQPNGSGTIVLQVADYYPFGSKFVPTSPNNDNKYLYNGKELQQDLALDWYDYGARFYDPVIGRWHVVDPVIQFASPYVGIGNNPINKIDPNGMAVITTADGFNITGDDVIMFLDQLSKTNDGRMSSGEFWKNLNFAAQQKAYPGMMLGVNCNSDGYNDLNYNRDEGFALNAKGQTAKEYYEEKRQQQKEDYLNRYYASQKEWAKGTFGLMGTIIAVPFLTTQASVDYFVAKVIGSVVSQFVTTGKVDVVDVAADALLKPGSGALLSGFINADLTRDGFQVSTNSTQDMLLVTGSTFVFNGAGGLFENATGSAFKGTQNGAAAAGITYGVTSFMTSTLNSITQYITK